MFLSVKWGWKFLPVKEIGSYETGERLSVSANPVPCDTISILYLKVFSKSVANLIQYNIFLYE